MKSLEVLWPYSACDIRGWERSGKPFLFETKHVLNFRSLPGPNSRDRTTEARVAPSEDATRPARGVPDREKDCIENGGHLMHTQEQGRSGRAGGAAQRESTGSACAGPKAQPTLSSVGNRTSYREAR